MRFAVKLSRQKPQLFSEMFVIISAYGRLNEIHDRAMLYFNWNLNSDSRKCSIYAEYIVSHFSTVYSF